MGLAKLQLLLTLLQVCLKVIKKFSNIYFKNRLNQYTSKVSANSVNLSINSKFIKEIKDKYSLSNNKIVLSGFSQGCMISLQTGIKRKDKINSIIGYSGKIINLEHLSKNIVSRPIESEDFYEE